MDFGDPVDGEDGVNRHVGHMDLAIFDDRHRVTVALGDVVLAEPDVLPPIDFLDDHIDARNEGLHVVDRPFLEGFGHDRVIGIGEKLGDDLPGLVPAITIFVHHKPHGLGDREDWVGVIQLDDIGIRELLKAAEAPIEGTHGGLKAGRDEEILLTEAEHTAVFGRIVWI